MRLLVGSCSMLQCLNAASATLSPLKQKQCRGIILLCAASCCWWMAWQDSHRNGSLQPIQESFGPDGMCRCLPSGRARSWLSGVVTGSDASFWLSSAGPFGCCGAFALKWSVPGCFCTAGAVGCPLLWFASAFAGGSDLVPAAAA